MANPWFRMYAEFAHDPKVQMMSEVHQRRLVMVFCFRCSDTPLDDASVAFMLRVAPGELAATKAEFIEIGLIDADWNILNWNKRQFLSDTSTPRVKKHRKSRAESEMKQDETLQEQHDAVTVTPPDTDTDTDTDADAEAEAEKTNTPPRAPTAAAAIPVGANGEFMVATNLLQELKLAATSRDIGVVAQVLALEAAEHGGTVEAGEYIIERATAAQQRGEHITVFWIKDRKFSATGENHGRPQQHQSRYPTSKGDINQRVFDQLASEFAAAREDAPGARRLAASNAVTLDGEDLHQRPSGLQPG